MPSAGEATFCFLLLADKKEGVWRDATRRIFPKARSQRRINMKIAIFLLALSLLGCSLHSRATDEPIEHHGQTVKVSDNPADCLACHADQTGKGHHPIAIAYPPQGKEASFLPAKALKSNGMHLFKKQVVCTSCHNLKNPEKSHLAIDNSNSRLCLLCHRK
jgi:hypothetical protein